MGEELKGGNYIPSQVALANDDVGVLLSSVASSSVAAFLATVVMDLIVNLSRNHVLAERPMCFRDVNI